MRIFMKSDAMWRSEQVRELLGLPDPEQVDVVIFGAGLVSVHLPNGGGSLHFLLPPEKLRCVYKDDPANPGHHREVCSQWGVWGRATEPYDLCLEYFGLGPFFEACWLPSERPPAPVRALGRLAGWLSEAVCAVLDPLEHRWPTLERAPGSMGLSLLSCRLADHALELDPAPCGHPGCRWSWDQRCLFPDPGVSAGEVDSHGELELRLELGDAHGSVWLSRETWLAWGAAAGWDLLLPGSEAGSISTGTNPQPEACSSPEPSNDDPAGRQQ